MLAQQNLSSSSASDESRRLRMLLNNRGIGLVKDGVSNSVGDVVPNVGSPLQAGGPVLPRGDTDMLIKVRAVACAFSAVALIGFCIPSTLLDVTIVVLDF